MIRYAIENDIPRLLDMGVAMHAESYWGDVPFSATKMEALFKTLMTADGAILVVNERNGVVIGAMAGSISSHWMSEATVACDLFLYVEPAHRGGMTAMRLINTYTGWALNRKAGKILLGAMTGVNPEATAKLYHHAGYRPMGTMHQYERVA